MARSPSRRTDDRYPRNERGHGSHRSRSRDRDYDRDRRERERDVYYGSHRRGDGRRDYSPPRRSSPSRRYSPPRRREGRLTPQNDRRSPERSVKRSRDPSPRAVWRSDDQDAYRGSRRSPYADSRKRQKRDDFPNRRAERTTSRDRGSHKTSSAKAEFSRPSTADSEAQSAEQAQRERLARVEAWKKKMAMQSDAAASASSSPQPAVKAEAEVLTKSASAASASAMEESESVADAPYEGKFDPKAIAKSKRASSATERRKTALGGDVIIPKSANQAYNVKSVKSANISKSNPAQRSNGTTLPADNDTKISAFGLNKATAEIIDRSATGKTATNLDDEEVIERKLEKLPDIPSEADLGDTMLANGADEQDESNDIQTDDEEAEATREAAHKRAQDAQAEQEDVKMTDDLENGVAEPAIDVAMADVPGDEEEEVDPLDAFMSQLETPADNDLRKLTIGESKNKQLQVFNHDDDGDMDAVGDNADDVLAAMAAKRKKKELPVVNHAKMQYEPFRRDFYAESVELAAMTEEDVAIVRSNLDNITVRGVNIPKPILKWSQGGFGTQILDVIRTMKFDKPTAIQSQALPAIMSGRDTIGVAKTGSGKTMAFILPMFRHIMDQRPLANLDGPIGLIMAPTRELATQIHKDCMPYLKALNLRAMCAYGGTSIKEHIDDAKRGAEIVVCTPGRMYELLASNSGRVTNLKRVTYVVLDEADRMFDMGFEPQVSKILANVRPSRQTVLFSATFPKNMEALARKALKKPVEIVVGGKSVVAAEITQVVEVRDEKSKFYRLLELLGELHDRDENARALIFVERQETADTLFKDVLKKGHPCVSIHGGREQIDRDQAIIDFKAGIVSIMIATSVAARGLDVKQLQLVINYDAPSHGEDYVHRCGRTGRAGNTGTAVTFITPEQGRFAGYMIKALSESMQEVPDVLRELDRSFKDKVESGEAKKSGSGFGGRGIARLEAARDAERARERKQYKTGDEPEDDDEKKDKDDKTSKVEELLNKAVSKVKDSAAQPEAASTSLLPVALNAHLNNAMKVEKVEKNPKVEKVQKVQKIGNVQKVQNVQKAEVLPASRPPANDALARVTAAAANINNRIGAKGSNRPGIPVDNRGPDAGAFHATLEINDFPQKARWAVTNRTNVAKILDSTGTSITSKGEYYPPPLQPATGEPPKLYLLVEGDTDVLVTTAMTQLTGLLREGTLSALAQDDRAPTTGRYSIF